MLGEGGFYALSRGDRRSPTPLSQHWERGGAQRRGEGRPSLLVLEQHVGAAAEEPAGAGGRFRDAADAAADDKSVGRQIERHADDELFAAGVELVIDGDAQPV